MSLDGNKEALCKRAERKIDEYEQIEERFRK